MEFSKELHDDIAAGDITVTFRLWRRPQAKVGGRYRVGPVEIEVDSMELVPFAAITEPTSAGPASPTARRCAGGPPTPGRSPTTRSCTGLRSTWSGSRRKSAAAPSRTRRATRTTRRTTCSNVPSATGR